MDKKKYGAGLPDSWPWDRGVAEGMKAYKELRLGLDEMAPLDTVSVIARNVKGVKRALGSAISAPAVFSSDVADGDVVVPVPCSALDPATSELLAVLRDRKEIPDAIWVPAFRNYDTTGSSSEEGEGSDPQPEPIYGIAFTDTGRVMLGPVVTHPRFKFHAGEKLYASVGGAITTAENHYWIGVCTGPSTIYLAGFVPTIVAAMDAMEKELVEKVGTSVSAAVGNILDGSTALDSAEVTATGSTTARTLADRAADVINVADFGAVGDGVTDDTAAFQLAIAYGESLGSDYCLFIPAGTYLVTELPSVPCYGPGNIVCDGTTYGPFELLFTIDDSIKRDSNGRYYVDTASLLENIVGDAEDSTDDFDKAMSDFIEYLLGQILAELESEDGDDSEGTATSAFKALLDEMFAMFAEYADELDSTNDFLKSLKIGIFLTGNKDWYVDGTNGSDDTSTDGRGESLSLPFKTIQACVDYVTTYYNMSSYASVIYILPGTYTESVELGSFSASTGSCYLRAYSDDYDTIIVNDGTYTINCTGGEWYLDRLVIRNVFANPGDGSYYYPSAVRATDGGALHVNGCKVYQSFSGDAPSSGDIQCRTIAAYSNGIIYLDASSYSYRTIEVHVNNATSLQVLFCERQGQIQGSGAATSQTYCTFVCSGECTYFCHLNDRGAYIQLGGSTYHTQFTDSGMTGQKYWIKKMSLCSLLEDGEDYFPGDTAGVVDADSFAYYGA